jgi:heme-degrading monooxygenase HmoA
MFVVIFRVQPKQERWDDYLELAKYLKPQLAEIDGFVDNERYASTREKGRLLSLSTWRDEKSVVRWRTQGEHHGVQEKGRYEIFSDYHLSVGEVTSDTEPPNGLKTEEQRFDETAVGTAKVITIAEIVPKRDAAIAVRSDELPARLGIGTRPDGCIDVEVFESILYPGTLLLLALWRDQDAARKWSPRPVAHAERIRYRHVRVIRDYGMFDRREAPQFYPEIHPSQGDRQIPRDGTGHR